MSSHPDAWLPQGYRGHVDHSQHAFIRNAARVVVTRSLGNDGTEVWSGNARAWVPLAPDEQLPDDAWTLDVPKPVARALYEALRAYYGEAELESVKSLTAAREAAERRCDALQAALIEIATRPVLAPVPAPLTFPGHAPGMRKPTRDDYMPRGNGPLHTGELPPEAFEGLPDGQTPKDL